MMKGRGQQATPGPEGPGLVHLYTGDGKGKTTAALGLALRAAGHNFRVHIVCFMKGSYPYGEWAALSRLPGVRVSLFGHDHFVDPEHVRPEEKEEARRALDCARQAVHSGQYDVVILDEVAVATGWKLLDTASVLQLIREKPENVELVLTGRYADRALIEAADVVTEMVKIKHPYDRGIESRRGIDH
jgi:cob(I)alamin adenosyltransferase